jgi:metal-dependent amidase/aminoacylase/carboxypeptidase family protein
MIEESIGLITTSTCEGAGATAKYDFTRGYPAVWNHPNETNRVEALAKSILGQEKVKRMTPIMGGEDFSYYLQKVPGTFFFVGGGNPDIKATYPHHHPRFDVDERSMIITGKIFISAVLDFLSETEQEI